MDELKEELKEITKGKANYEWQKENFKAYAFARGAENIFWINTQIEHAKGQKENFQAHAFARSAKKNF